MAFWGVEVSSSKPYVHKFDPSRGRLRISQATLGNGDSSTVTVQCSVGDKNPISLCNLIPKVCETCRLELEFEEDEEVVFSVRSSRSVYLTGYYLSNRPCLHGEDSESYGEDIAESDASDTYSDGSEDEYESDFIDDTDVAIYADSHRPKSSVVIEEIEDDDKQHHNRHRLKKHQISDSDDEETVCKQLAVRNKESMNGESEDEDGFPICFNVGDKASRKKKIRDDEKRKVDETSQNVVSISEANMAPRSTLPSETVSKNNENSKKRKKDDKSSVRSKTNDKQDSETNANLSINGIEEHAEESPNVVKNAQNKKKSKKRKLREEGLSVEIDSSIETKEDEMPVNNTAITDVNAVKKEKKKKKKKKDKKKNVDSDVIKQEASAEEKAEVLNGGGDELQRGSPAKKTRTFPNGLIVEEISMGKPIGKKAAPGKKVSVHYIGKLKNGTIFDSNIGQRPFKFRLGIGEVIKGWDIGVSGMCVGDKRRLTVPPSFGYGAKGVGKIPPNSWLVFDVELVDVN